MYAAEHDGRPVAVKVLHDELALSEQQRRRFLREADALAAVEHPNVVRILDAGTNDDGCPYLVMDRIDGETLAERLAGGPLPRDEAMRRFRELADALQALHDAGLVHRDIKPENIVCDGDRTVLLDLGIAKRAVDGHTRTQTGLVRGTPDYMAPERLFGVPASVASDVYELALVLYFMLVGEAPWEDATDPSARHDPAPIDDAANPALLRALSVSAKKRPQTVTALTRAITTIADGEERATATALVRPRPDRPRSGRWLAIVPTALITVGAIAAAAFWSAPTFARAPSQLLRPTLATATAASQQKPPATVPAVSAPPGEPSTKAPTPSLDKSVASSPFRAGPWCTRWLALRCSPEAITRMTPAPCASAKGALQQASGRQSSDAQEVMCEKMYVATRKVEPARRAWLANPNAQVPPVAPKPQTPTADNTVATP